MGNSSIGLFEPDWQQFPHHTSSQTKLTSMKKFQTSRMAFPFSILCLIPITALNTWAADATYQYYRFTTTQTAGESMIQVSEFDLINDGNKVDYTNLTVSNPGGSSPGGEEPPKVIDGNINTKWLDFNIAPLIFTFDAPVTIDSYNFATANDALGRTPISWTFEGSANGATWVEIDSRNSVTPPGSFFTFFNNAFELPNLSTAPTGVSDNYTLQEETVLVAATSVLSNDFGGGGALTATLETGPSNGQLLFNSDGTFTYLPDLDFAGQDSFAYRASGGLAPVIFNVDPSRSSANINSSLGVSGIGSDSSSDSSKFSGTLRANLSPSSLPYNEIQIDDLNLRLDDDLRFRFRFAFGLAGVNADINGGAVSVLMNTPGSPSAVDSNGEFNQTSNELRIVGTATVNGTGLASGAVPSGPQNLDTPVQNVDLTGTVVESEGTLTLTLPLNFSGSFDFDGNSLELAISGTVVATAPLPSPTGGEQSAPTNVTLNVIDDNDAPLLGEDVYYVDKNGFLEVSAGNGGVDTLITKESIWKYLDDGSDQGTAWKAADFDDNTWTSGAGELGFGDGDEGKEINSGEVTYYFRKEFTVSNSRDVSSLYVDLLRDDGAVIYLNGIEVARSNLPSSSNYLTLAVTTVGEQEESRYLRYEIDPLALIDGTNVLAVEVHQSSVTSTDLSFDLSLSRQRTAGLLTNDSDKEGDILQAGEVLQSGKGTAVIQADGSFTYLPNPGYTGEAGFLYEAGSSGDVPSVFLPRGARWRYLDDGSDQGTIWRNADFDDSSWSSGFSEMGYGDGDELTEVGFGGDSSNRFATTYFRNEFFLQDVATTGLQFLIKRDDAAAIYLNGSEIYRDSNLAPGATFSDYALSQIEDEQQFATVLVPPGQLIEGRNVVAVEVHQANGTSSDLSFDFEIRAEIPAVTLVDQKRVWNYLDDGSDQGTEWRGPNFEDRVWSTGPAPLGYGNGNQATSLSFGSDSNNKHETSYFRTSFEVADESLVKGLLLRLLMDDGMAVYLNGVEVYRKNLAANAPFDALATATVSDFEELYYEPVSLDPSALVTGKNILAVEVHQASLTSSDLVFDLELSATVSSVIQRGRIVVLESEAPADSDNDGMLDSYERTFGLIVGIDDSALDPDRDGHSNLQESWAYTGPFDPNSRLRITEITISNGMVDLDFTTVAGIVYRLEASTNLTDWFPVDGVSLTAVTTNWTFSLPKPAEETYWRVVTGP